MKIKVIILFLLFAFSKQGTPQFIVSGDSLSPNVHYERIDTTLLLPWHACTSVFKAIDITNDGIVDLNFEYWNCASPSFNAERRSVYILNHSVQLAVKQNAINWIDTISVGAVINNTLRWRDTTTVFTLHSYSNSFQGNSSSGLFNTTNKFMAFRVIGINDTVYGWIRIEKSATNGLLGIVVKSYASGFPLIGLNSAFSNQNLINVYPNPTKDFMYIQSWESEKTQEILLLDVSGKSVLSPQTINSKTTEIDLRNLSNGIYFLRVRYEDGVVTKKVVVQH